MAEALPPASAASGQESGHQAADSLSPPTEAGGNSVPTLPPLGGVTPFEETAQLPGYEILEELGRGGMGVVLKARQKGLNRIVALKLILSGPFAAAEELARFQAEAEALGRLQHPGIVVVHEVGSHASRPFFSLEYCPGGSLEKKLAGAPLSPYDAAALVARLAEATQAAHEARVIHRDLKPANVLLMSDGTPKISDFGLAKKLDEQGQTQTGTVMGTPCYMAPEQAQGKKVGPVADVYSLGAILYECLTGRPPFKGATTLDTLAMVIHNEPTPPRKLEPKVARDVETICLKCLEKNPACRYASAKDLAADLSRFLAGEQIQARPAGPFRRAGRWFRRHWKAAALVGGVLALVALYLGYRATQGPNSLAVRRACPLVPWEPEEVETIDAKPSQPDMSGFEVLERSTLVDFRLWKPVPDHRRAERTEPMMNTIVYRLRKRPGEGDNRWLRQQFRTSGVAVDPRCANHPYRVVKYQYADAMPDDRNGKQKRIMTTWELVVDLEGVGNRGEVFEVIVHAQWWNAYQDQEQGKATDWHATRFDYPLEKADTTVILPRGKRLTRWGFSDFPVGSDQPYPSDQTPGTRVDPDRGFIHWDVPPPQPGRIYRVDWSWTDR